MVNSYEAEYALIGCLLTGSIRNYEAEVFSSVHEKMFLTDEMRSIFKVCLDSYNENGFVDKVYVFCSISSKPELIDYANYAIDSLPSVSGWKIYMKKVIDSYAMNKSVSSAQDLIDTVSSGTATIDDIKELAERVLTPFNEVSKCKSTVANEAVDIFDTEQSRKPDYISFGFPTFDDITSIELGDLIVIGGRPSAGKTAVSLNMMLHLAKRYKTVFFSLETRREKIIDRMVSCYCGIPLYNIKNRCLTDEQRDRWNKFKKGFGELNFEIVECSGKNAQWIRAESIKREAQIVFVDYLGIVKGHGNGRYEIVTNTITDLHEMAQSERITTVVLCQIKRASLANEMPTMADLKESGAIEEASDVIVLLHNGYEKGYKMIVGKNKDGQVGTIDMVFTPGTQTIAEEISDIDDPFI